MGRYAIFNGLVYGGGTEVIPNPEGTPTEELHSLQIGEDIYEIVGGGGSGEGYSETLLYETTTPFQTGVITLNDDISNYDVLLFRTKFSDETRADLLLQVSLLQDVGYVASPSTSTKHALLLGFSSYYFRVVKGSETDDNIINIFAASGDQFIYEIYGIKLEGGGGSSTSVQRLSPEAYSALPQSEKENGTIYFVHKDAGETTISGTFTTGSTQYEKIIVNCGFKPTSISVILPFSNGDTYAKYDESISTTTSTWEIPMESRTYTIILGSETGESGITDILNDGFKFRCNASNTRNVNCTFEATGVLDDEINKIYYMGDEYTDDNSDGGGSQELISYDTTITTTKYGWWTAEDKDGNILDPNQYELIAVTPIVNNSPSWVGSWDGAFFINTEDGTTHHYDVTFVNINDGGYIRTSRTWNVKVIYRDKNAVGGGGGSTVVPNPQEEPTDTLNTVKIDGIVYDIEGGSEGGQGLNPANYSTEEEVIGVWTNNLPVYKKTWTFSSAITVASSSWADTSISVNDTQIHTIVNCEAVGPNGQAWTCISATTDEATQTYVRVLNTRNTDVNVKHLTLYYIKDGDSPIVPPGAKGEYNYYGGFIDTNNIIDSGTYTGTFTYIATEDCYVNVALINNSNSDAKITIDGAVINYTWSTNGITIYQTLPLKKGQTLVATSSAGSSLDYTVYGISYASGSSGTSEGEGVEIYSEDEYIVGKWIDGKKLYQRTYHLAQAITVAGGGTWTNTGIDISDISILVDSKFSQDIAVWDAINGINDNGILKATILASGSLTVDTITIRYTKTVETPAPTWGGSVTNNYASFINTANVIYSTVSSLITDTYTATEDCYIMQDVIVGTNVATVQIDRETVAEYSFSGTQLLSYNAYLKKGQTITVTHGATSAHTIKVFGISYGSGSSSSGNKIEYSTEEKEIGTWIDGSKVYELTIFNDNLTDTSTVPHAMYIGSIPANANIVTELSVSVCDSNHAGWVGGGGICTVNGWNFGLHITEGKVVLYGGNVSAIQGGMAIAKIRYTKTTT